MEPGVEVIPIVEEHILENHCESNIMASVFKLKNFKGVGIQRVEWYLKRRAQYKMCNGKTNELRYIDSIG